MKDLASLLQVCLVDISKDGQRIASQLSSQFHNNSVSYRHCDITDYESFKGKLLNLTQKFISLSKKLIKIIYNVKNSSCYIPALTSNTIQIISL